MDSNLCEVENHCFSNSAGDVIACKFRENSSENSSFTCKIIASNMKLNE